MRLKLLHVLFLLDIVAWCLYRMFNLYICHYFVRYNLFFCHWFRHGCFIHCFATTYATTLASSLLAKVHLQLPESFVCEGTMQPVSILYHRFL